MKIFIVSDSPLKQTGYGRQSRDLHAMFTALGHTVVFFGMHSLVEGTAIQEYNGSKIYALNGPDHPEGQWVGPSRHWIQSAVLSEKPDVIILVWDLRKIMGLVRDFDRFFRCPIFLYWLFDASPISHQYFDLMRNTRVEILPVSLCIADWIDDADIPRRYDPIPEPIDLSRFYPLPEEARAKLKAKYLGKYADCFCYGFVGGNFQRKNIPFLIDAFSELETEILNNSVLFLHTDPTAFQRSPTCYDLRDIIHRYHPDIEDRIIFSQQNNDLAFNMAEIYNVMDVQASASTGEGWGLGSVEGMACGIPMIIGDISTSREIVGDSGFIVPVSGALYSPNPYLRITIPDFDKFVSAMSDAFTEFANDKADVRFPEWDIRSKSKESGRYSARRNQSIERARIFDIDKVTRLWDNFFKSIEESAHWSDELVNEYVIICGEEDAKTA